MSAKEDGGALVFREGGEGLFNALLEFGLEAGGGWVGGDRVFQLVVQSQVIHSCGSGVQGFGGVSAATAQFVKAEVPSDGVEPGGESRGNPVAVGGLVNLDEDDLGEVLSFLQIAEHAIDEVHDGLFVFLDQRFKSGGIAALNT